MSNTTNEGLNLSYSNPADNFGSNNLRDLIVILHESGKGHETIYNVLNMIGVDKQKAYEAIEMYIPKKIQNQQMEIKEKLEASKEVLDNLDKLSAEDDSLKKAAKEVAEDMTMMIGPGKAKKDKAKETTEDMTMMIGKGKVKKGTKIVESSLDLMGKASLIKAIASNMPANYQTSAIKNICEKYLQLASNPSNSHGTLAKNFIAELNQYSWIQPIADAVNELTEAINEHAVTIHLYEAHLKLTRSSRNEYFSNAINEIENMLELTESEIRENGTYKLSNHSWIPEVKAVINHINSYNKDLNEGSEHIVNKKFSPVIEFKGGHVFSLSGNTYMVKNNEISALSPNELGAAYLTLLAVEENFKFSDNKMTMYKNNHTYDIMLSESGKTFMLDGRELLFKETAQLKNLLMSTAHFGINEMYQIDMMTSAYDNAEKFVELDFVQSIQPRFKNGVVANVMRLGESIYINKINKSMKVNEFFKAENATKAVEIIKEFINYDITPAVVDLLEEDTKNAKLLESKKADLLDKITFLKEKKGELSKHDIKNEYIAEANKLITEEIEKLQKDFNSIL